MAVHLFGAVSSPSCAGYALRKAAEDYHLEFLAEVLQAVRQNSMWTMVSSATEGEAIQMIRDLIALCQKRGFILEKWIRNTCLRT